MSKHSNSEPTKDTCPTCKHHWDDHGYRKCIGWRNLCQCKADVPNATWDGYRWVPDGSVTPVKPAGGEYNGGKCERCGGPTKTIIGPASGFTYTDYCENCDRVTTSDTTESQATDKPCDPGRQVATVKKWRQTEKGKASRTATSRKAYAKFTDKHKARSAVSRALTTGDLVRPDSCEHCHKPCKPQGHHEDHSKYLEVNWLCSKCHAIRHRELLI
jgi:hypothetical protein